MLQEKVDNYSRAMELKREVEKWVDQEFNYVRLSVMERIARNPETGTGDYISELYEHIRSQPITDYLSDYIASLAEDEKEELTSEVILWEGESIVTSDQIADYVVDQREQEVRDFMCENGYEDENYPLWDTIFEFRTDNPPSEWLDYAQEVGLGVIDAFDEFHPSLFATSAGHSFYSPYWIPLYLKCFPMEKEKYKNVDFQMV